MRYARLDVWIIVGTNVSFRVDDHPAWRQVWEGVALQVENAGRERLSLVVVREQIQRGLAPLPSVR